ncbi:MAG: SRPBCC family protein [Acidimicrobiia bacterium]
MSDVTASHDGTLERTADGGLIRFERHLPYPVAAVWDAITNPERLTDWWLPFDADITVELRVDGEMVFTSRTGEPPPMTATILRIDAPSLLEHTHLAPGSTLRWELEGVETGCLLRLTQHVTDVTEAIEGCWIAGLHTSFSLLEPCLAGSPMPWNWDEFAATRAHYAALGLATPDTGE